MTAVFLRIVNISFTAGWLIIAVIALRLLLKKAPKWLICVLWALVALRLLFPFSIESALSLIPSNEVISESIVSNETPAVNTGFIAVNNAVNPIISETFTSEEQTNHNPVETVIIVASIVWIIGMAAMLIYALFSFVNLKKQVRTAIPLGKEKYSKNTFICDDIKTPFILGIIRPQIFIPSSIDEETMEYVYAHECAHLKRRDHWWKPLGFILLSVYWFNPLCWVAYILLCKDIEAACDEKVISDKDRNYLAMYSQALLDCAVQRKKISACPLAFGETGVKSRVKGVLSYKKPTFWIIIIAVVAIVVAAVCFLTNPKKTNPAEENVPELVVETEKTEELKEGNTEETNIEEQVEDNPTEIPENLGINYEYADGQYVVDGDELYQYKKILVGKTPNAACPSEFVVLTNDEEITYEKVAKSIFSSNMDDWLTDTVIIEMEALTESFEGFAVWPTESTRISAEYDENNHPETDIAGDEGDTVYAIADGKVIFAGWDEGNGNTVKIVSSNAVIEYHHLKTISVGECDEVKAGDVIGELGNTGLSTGPHLGISLEVNGTTKNLVDYYNN